MGLIAVVFAGLCVAGAPADPDLAPLYCSDQADAKKPPRDGRVLSPDAPPEGVSETKVRMIDKLATRRDKLLESGGGHMAELEALFRTVETTKDRDALKKQLEQMSGDDLDEAGEALVQAVKAEKKRLVILEKLGEEAFENHKRLPGVDQRLVSRLLRKYDAGDVDAMVEAYTTGVRLVAEGLIAYLDDDLIGAVSKLKAATTECPDLAVAFLYLGSVSYIIKQESAAIAAWRRVLELEPNNKVVRETLRDLGVPVPRGKRHHTAKSKGNGNGTGNHNGHSGKAK